MSFRSSLIIALLAFSLQSTAQKDVSFFEGIVSVAKPLTDRIQDGKIDEFRGQTPPENTWTYKRLVECKKIMEAPGRLFRGAHIDKSPVTEGFYSYNSYAYHIVDDKIEYLFAAIISLDTRNGDPKISGMYLFTEDAALQSWWSSTLRFYESEERLLIPEKFVPPICPPYPGFVVTK